MNRFALPLLLTSFLPGTFAPLHAADENKLTADSKPQDGVPKGDVLKFTFDKSRTYPGTTRDYWVYIPRQYDPATPACVYVNQDGVQWNAPVVFDNLIAKKEMPVTVGVFVTPGRVKAPNPNALDRFNRSYEYDGLGDAYARFILDELLPDVETKTATDGRAIHLSKNGNDRAIGGSSSGAIAAFTAAWARPDAFSRVFSAIGTFVGLRGGDVYPTLIRKYEPKPLRVFLQDGSNDQNIYGGDWWMQNQEMERALTFAGYEVNHAWGTGGHNGNQGTAIFPDVMRWLWKDWPQPVKAGAGSPPLQEILLPSEGWKSVGEGYTQTSGPAVQRTGEVLFNSVSKTYRIGLDGKVGQFPVNTGWVSSQAFGPDGRLYAITAGGRSIIAYDAQGHSTIVASIPNHIMAPASLVVRSEGSLYFTDTGAPTPSPFPVRIWRLTPPARQKVVADSLQMTVPTGITLSPDQTLLYVADGHSHWVYSYQIQPDGSLLHKQRYYHLHAPDDADDSGAGGMAVDRDGRLYVATRIGIQICDQAGRVNCIVPTPNGIVTDVVIGGPAFDTLFAICGDKVYSRKLKVKAALSFMPPVKPAAPRL